MENEEIFSSLKQKEKIIAGIKQDDGYNINIIERVAKDCILLIAQLNEDGNVNKGMIDNATAEFSAVDAIVERYFNDDAYDKFLKKQSRAGNVTIFMNALRRVEGTLVRFLQDAGY